MSIGMIVLIILVIALLGGFSGIGGGLFYGTGFYGGGGFGPRLGCCAHSGFAWKILNHQLTARPLDAGTRVSPGHFSRKVSTWRTLFDLADE